jgi:hypothetical protein
MKQTCTEQLKQPYIAAVLHINLPFLQNDTLSNLLISFILLARQQRIEAEGRRQRDKPVDEAD